MRYIVCGGRDYKDYDSVEEVVKSFPEGTTVVNGGCPSGVDKYVRTAARKFGYRLETYNAQWHLHGRAAGPIRNRRMAELDGVEKVFAFPGGSGTSDMRIAAEERNIEVVLCGRT